MNAAKPLSEALRTDLGVRAIVMGEPRAVRRAAASVRRRWPDADPGLNADDDPERLAIDMDKRRERNDWRDYSWVDVTRTACALIDGGLWNEWRFRRLRKFLLAQFRHGASPPPNGYGVYVRAMFAKYMGKYDAQSKMTQDLAAGLAESWERAGLRIDALAHRFAIFDPKASPHRRIATLMRDSASPYEALIDAGFAAPHGDGLMHQAHLCFANDMAEEIGAGHEGAVAKMLRWMMPPNASQMQGAGAEAGVNALLLPWASASPPDGIKEALTARLTEAYGDPRIKNTGVWTACAAEALAVMLKWLTGATIHEFFKIVSEADSSHMWSDRKGLWLDLHRSNRISSAWFALSDEGIAIARNIRGGAPDRAALPCGRNKSRGAGDRGKCLLIMEIDGRCVVEGSHSCPTYVFPRGKDDVERFGDSYDFQWFRDRMRKPWAPARIVHIGHWRNKVLRALL